MPRSRGDHHNWNSLDGYSTVLDAQLRRLGDYFVDRSDLSVTLDGPDRLRIEGRIHCHHGLYVDVVEILTINERRQVRCEYAKYHAGLAGEEGRAIFRDDNAHVYAREGHPDAYHKHRFDHSTGKEIAPPV